MPSTNHPREPLTIGQWVRRILISGAVLLVLLFAGARWNLRQQVNAELNRIRAAGQPVTLEELDRRHADLGNRRNTSAQLAAAIAELQASWDHLFTNTFDSQLVADELPLMGKGPKLAVAESIPAGFTNSVTLAMKGMTPAFDRLGRVLAEPNAGFRNSIALTNGIETLLPHLSQFKQLAQWHALRAAWQLDRGEGDAAVQTTINLFRLSRVMESEPTLISQLVRLAMIRVALTSIERLVAIHVLLPDQAGSLRDELRAARPDRAIFIGMLGERCMGLDAMRPGSTSLLGPESHHRTDTREGFLARATFLAYRMTGLADRDAKFYLQTMNRAISTSTNSVRERVTLVNDGKTFNTSAHGKLYFFSSMLLPALDKAFIKDADCLTAIAAADAALAVETWRAANEGRIPDSLADLVPEFFPEAPVDPATEKPLSIVPAATGYAIHGSGPLFTVRR